MANEFSIQAPDSVFIVEYLPDAIQPFAGYIEGAIIACLIFIIGWILSKWANRVVYGTLSQRVKVDQSVSKFFGTIAQYSILGISFVAALSQVGVQTTSLVAIFASAGLAAGLALQGSLSNFASGVMILIFRPFVLGDLITSDNIQGTVRDIGIFTTTIENIEQDHILIPNSKVVNETIINHTVSKTRRVTVSVGVAYDSPFDEVLAVLIAAALRADGVIDTPEPSVAFVDMASSSINFKVHAFCNAEDYLLTLHNVRTAIFKDLSDANIEIPFQQVVMKHA